MKKTLFTLCMLLLNNVIMAYPIIERPITIKYGEKYRVTAETRNQFGKNYWVDLIVEGYITTYSKSISDVYYDDGNGLKRLSYYRDYSYENVYYVTIDNEKYYFKF